MCARATVPSLHMVSQTDRDRQTEIYRDIQRDGGVGRIGVLFVHEKNTKNKENRTPNEALPGRLRGAPEPTRK